MMGQRIAMEQEGDVQDVGAASAEFRHEGASKQTRNKQSTKTHQSLEKSTDGASKSIAAGIAASCPTPPLTPMTAPRALPLLVCSIGNPGSTYANTLHSAGHTALNRLAERLGYPPFHKDRTLGNGLVSKAPTTGESGDWTLWQSTSYMNDSGKGVRAAYLAWSRHLPGGEGRLVVVHDELEKTLGAVTVKPAQGASAKGHNGLKSIFAVMGQVPVMRIGIGIGRPLSRESDDVARYVLQKMTPAEKSKIEGGVEEVIAKLRQLEKG